MILRKIKESTFVQNSIKKLEIKNRLFVALTCLIIILIITFGFYIVFLLTLSLLVGVGIAHFFLSGKQFLPNFLVANQKTQHKTLDTFELSLKKQECTICGLINCPRHRPELNLLAFQPWTNTSVPLSVDTALEQFLEIVTEKFIYSWYKKLSVDEQLIDELRMSIRYAVAVLLRRFLRVDIAKFITEKLKKVLLPHFNSYMYATGYGGCEEDVEKLSLRYYGNNLHCIMHSRHSELEYVRRLVEQIFPYILSPQAINCRCVRSLIREIFAGGLIVPGMDAIADPDMVNNLILTLVDQSPSPRATEPPSKTVEILTNFSHPRFNTDSCLRLAIEDVMSRENTHLLYAFMQFLKSEAAINVMQFTLQCEDFNSRILNAEMSTDEKEELYGIVNELYSYYCSEKARDKINFQDDIIQELKEVIEMPVENITCLRQRTCLFKAYEHTYNLLENTFLPLFHQSDYYFTMLCGGRITAKTNKGLHRASKKKESGFSNIGSKIIDAFRSNTVDGRFSEDEDVSNYNSDTQDNVLCDNVDLSPDYDLSAWRVSIPCIGARPHPNNKKKQMFVFMLEVRRVDITDNDNEASSWSVSRKYKEFYVLEQKLKEFHGEELDICLPPRKTLGTRQYEFIESKIFVFEDYLQKLLCIPKLKGSKLLYTFLTSDTEFTISFLPELNFGRMIKTVPMILLKEKGKHLDTFLSSFLTSTESGKPSQGRIERRGSDSSILSASSEMSSKSNSIYGNNANMVIFSGVQASEPDRHDLQIHSLFEALIYIIGKIYDVPHWLHCALCTLKVTFGATFDAYAEKFIRYRLSLVSQEHRLVGFINLFSDVLFGEEHKIRSDADRLERLNQTYIEVKQFIPSLLTFLVSEKVIDRGAHIIDMFQYPKLNKQLSYTLLDLIVEELFPELIGASSDQKGDKS